MSGNGSVVTGLFAVVVSGSTNLVVLMSSLEDVVIWDAVVVVSSFIGVVVSVLIVVDAAVVVSGSALVVSGSVETEVKTKVVFAGVVFIGVVPDDSPDPSVLA